MARNNKIIMNCFKRMYLKNYICENMNFTTDLERYGYDSIPGKNITMLNTSIVLIYIYLSPQLNIKWQLKKT